MSTPLGDRLAAVLSEGSRGTRLLAEFLLRNPIRAPALSIEDLAAAAGVSPATISRFARSLGYSGFAALRHAVADAVQDELDPVAKLRRRLDGGAREGGAESIIVARGHLSALDAELLETEAREIAREIASARNVHVMGFGLSAHVAALLVLGLQPFRPQVSGVVEFGGTEVAAGRLMGIGPDDLLVAITFPRYASDVVQLVRYARDRGARVLALTDSPAAPIAPLADRVLFAPADHPTLSSSMVAAVAVVEALVAAVMLSDPANAERASLLEAAIGGYLHRKR